MNEVKMQRFQELFEKQKAELLYSQADLADDLVIQSGEISDEVDLTSYELEQSMRIRLRSREALFLKKLDEALGRISQGTFGCCEDCGGEIEEKRLLARPTATLCIGCKEVEEHKEHGSADGRRHKSVGSRLMLVG